MRVRLLRNVFIGDKLHYVGEVVNVSRAVAGSWMEKDIAMQDKSLDGAFETKISPIGRAVKWLSRKF